jgi:hypothetical protein
MFNGHPILEGFHKDGLPYADWTFYDLTKGYKTMNAGFVDGCEITADGADCPECPAFYE